MISYAQNAEDVVLARLGGTGGRYVDIGAGDPVEASVTKHFYDLGWSGVNVEPIPAKADQLRRARPRDTTLSVAVGASPGTATLHHVVSAWGWSTLDARLAETYRRSEDWSVEAVEVEVVTLAQVLDRHPGPVDFLKIDVEGYERDVIAGGDWDRHRPRVVVVEATEPGSPSPTHREWEPTLLEAGYRCALFDGLNRFYAQAEDTEALSRLAVPANVFDGYERDDVIRQRDALRALEVTRVAEVEYTRRAERSIRELRRAGERDAEYLRSLEAGIADGERRLRAASRYTAALEQRVIELEADKAELAARLAELAAKASTPEG